MSETKHLTTYIKDINTVLDKHYYIEFILNNNKPIKQITWKLSYDSDPWVVGGWLNRPNTSGEIPTEVLNDTRLQENKDDYTIRWSGSGDFTLTANNYIPIGDGIVMRFLFGNSEHLQMSVGEGSLIVKDVDVNYYDGFNETIIINSKCIISVNEKIIEPSSVNNEDHEDDIVVMIHDYDAPEEKESEDIIVMIDDTPKEKESEEQLPEEEQLAEEEQLPDININVKEINNESVTISIKNNSDIDLTNTYIYLTENNGDYNQIYIHEYVYNVQQQNNNSWFLPKEDKLLELDKTVSANTSNDVINALLKDSLIKAVQDELKYRKTNVMEEKNKLESSSGAIYYMDNITNINKQNELLINIKFTEYFNQNYMRQLRINLATSHGAKTEMVDIPPTINNYYYMYLSDKYISQDISHLSETTTNQKWTNIVVNGTIDTSLDDIVSEISNDTTHIRIVGTNHTKLSSKSNSKMSLWKGFKLENNIISNIPVNIEHIELGKYVSLSQSIKLINSKDITIKLNNVKTNGNIVIDNSSDGYLKNIYSKGVHIKNSNKMTLENLNISKNTSGEALYIDNSNTIQINDSDIIDSNNTAVYSESSENVNINNCRITNSVGTGAHFNNSNSLTLKNCTFKDTNTGDTNLYACHIEGTTEQYINITDNKFIGGNKIYSTDNNASINIYQNTLYLYNYKNDSNYSENNWWLSGNVYGEDNIMNIKELLTEKVIWNNIQQINDDSIYTNIVQYLKSETDDASLQANLSNVLYDLYNNKYKMQTILTQQEKTAKQALNDDITNNILKTSVMNAIQNEISSKTKVVLIDKK